MGKEAKGFEFSKYATPRIIGGIAIVVIVLWALSVIFGSSDGTPSRQAAVRHETPVATTHKPLGSSGHTTKATDEAASGHSVATAPRSDTSREAASTAPPVARELGSATRPKTTVHQTADTQAAPETRATAGHAPATTAQSQAHPQPAAADKHGKAEAGHAAAKKEAVEHGAATGHPVAGAPAHKPQPKGVAFVEATINPLRYELEERWWGWRPNDLIDVTDNVNNFQMGVLEVTRRTVVALAERISRTGVTDALNPNLEDAMNWFMVKAGSYWFPSAESKYREGLNELEAYLAKLKEGKATFYTRTDNLIPLLASFEDLMGSCDENLVKEIEEDGSPVSFFSADNYFFYTQGVASAMATVLEAVHHDFLPTLESRHGSEELLHHAIVSCQRAAEIDPWIIMNRDLSSLFANHRANMAAPISHARFYLGQLIKTLST